MPRPNKCKKVGQLPRFRAFFTKEAKENMKIVLQVEEFEAIRLIDYLGMTQEECAASMEVGRATVQSLYTSARGKLARYLVEGGTLEIEGGNYSLDNRGTEISERKEKPRTRIAVPWEDGRIFPHFGRARCFKLYDVVQNQVTDTRILDSGEYSRRMLADLLSREAVQIVICGGIGAGARNALAEREICIYPGAEGDADMQVLSFLSGGGSTRRERNSERPEECKG